VRGWVGMGVKSAGMGGDGTKIPSPCTPLVRRYFCVCAHMFRKFGEIHLQTVDIPITGDVAGLQNAFSSVG